MKLIRATVIAFSIALFTTLCNHKPRTNDVQQMLDGKKDVSLSLQMKPMLHS
ncbi:hypothetical protein [Paracerasibacillus soli]|uniref:Uncharacterized protein n=1 Tax=Paracerasibacillus soli TaxID=480284 RepID=A0ABU5CTQ6_9BACI|nr:hypothetical protein [Virgibacillus soli]MDY0409719.1 hypothetical protein [Virgibacillus soli]